VRDRSAAREDGFTLVEIVIAVAIVAATVAAGVGISLGSRSLAVSTAAGEFDQFLDSARTIARGLDGAVLAFTPDAYGDGTEVRLLSGGPNDEPAATTLPTLHARATIEEAESLGKAPFAFVVHANGSLSGRPGYRVGDTAKNDVGCPPSGAFHFVIKTAGGSADRFVPCRMTLANTGPATLTAWPWATLAPMPTPCGGVGCTATSLPGVPTSTASCPPTFTATAGGCAPNPPPGSGARYHVTITGAPATINVGATGSFTVQATLTNASAVPAGTPLSIPVEIQTADTTCTTTPPGWQPSASGFIVTGGAPGICTLTAEANATTVSGATTDAATVTVAVTRAAGATPIPAPEKCDLIENGKCYRRIVDQTTQTFTKNVLADSTCDMAQPNSPCAYLDSIRSITLDGFVLSPAVPPVDELHELLFRIDDIRSLLYACVPISTLVTISPTDTLALFARGIGTPANPPSGFGRPSVYTTVNNVFAGNVPPSFDEKQLSLAVIPTFSDMFDAIARAEIGDTYSFLYHSADASRSPKIVWLPDFPGCDNSGDISTNREYGYVSAALTFEVFQAMQ
jgi:prepilin-type N-terminal cleavage/methylation domain-containing protein